MTATVRTIVMLSLALLLGACAHQAAPREDTVPALVSTTPAPRTGAEWNARHQRILADARVGGHEIAFIGASIIEGWPNAGAAPWNAVWLPRRSVNCGIGGDRTQHVLYRLDDGLLEALTAPNNRIRWVVLNIGSNNTDTDSAEEIAAGVRAVIARLRTGLPQARFVVSLFPRGQWPNPLREKMRGALDLLAARYAGHTHVVVQDMWPFFLSPSGEITPETMPDHLHLSPASYQTWSDELEKVIPAPR